MIQRNPDNGKLRFYCDECGWRISSFQYSPLEGELSVEDGGLDPRHAEQHLCVRCSDKIWAQTVGVHCHTDCRAEPCENGGGCWVNPWPKIMYLCFVGKRIGSYHPMILDGIAFVIDGQKRQED